MVTARNPPVPATWAVIESLPEPALTVSPAPDAVSTMSTELPAVPPSRVKAYCAAVKSIGARPQAADGGQAARRRQQPSINSETRSAESSTTRLLGVLVGVDVRTVTVPLIACKLPAARS